MKAKLEAIESGIASFGQEFYAHTMLTSGRTVFEKTDEQMSQKIVSRMPGRLMLEGSTR